MIYEEFKDTIQLYEDFTTAFIGKVQGLKDKLVHLKDETPDSIDDSITTAELHRIDGLIKLTVLDDTGSWTKLRRLLWDIDNLILSVTSKRVLKFEEAEEKKKEIKIVNKIENSIAGMSAENKAALLKMLREQE